MPYVIVGGHKTLVSWKEYFVAKLPEGTPVWWAEKSMIFYDKSKAGNCKDLVDLVEEANQIAEGQGIFLYSWFYDGVVAQIDVGGKQRSISMFCKHSKVKRIKDRSKLNCLGEGI